MKFKSPGGLPLLTQRLLVLICGTLRTIAAGSETNRMNAEALGVSVAPSFFRSCDGINKTARMEDIIKFKVSSHRCPTLHRSQSFRDEREEKTFSFNLCRVFTLLCGFYQL